MPPRSRPSRHPVHAPQEVRIIGGQFKRSPLSVPQWPGLRPTPARVRETLFNWLGQDLTGWRVLDAFAGSGALGLEAASRGACAVWMLEREGSLAAHIRASAQRLGAQGVTVQTADALKWMQTGLPPAVSTGFDLVLLDPPFDDDLFAQALSLAARCVVPGGWIYLEAPRPVSPGNADPGPAEATIALPDGLFLHRHGQAGVVHYHLIGRRVAGEA